MMKLLTIQDEETFQECIMLFYDKLNIIIILMGILIASTIAITSYYKDQPLINFFINILVVFGIYYGILIVLLFKFYKKKLKENEKKKSESDSIPIFGAPSLFRSRYKKW